MQSMEQGVVLLGEEDQILFMNLSVKKIIQTAMETLFDHHMANLDNNHLYLEDNQFLDVKIFSLKINEEDLTFGASR